MQVLTPWGDFLAKNKLSSCMFVKGVFVALKLALETPEAVIKHGKLSCDSDIELGQHDHITAYFIGQSSPFLCIPMDEVIHLCAEAIQERVSYIINYNYKVTNLHCFEDIFQ